MWASAPVLLPTEDRYSHLWFLPGWSLLTSSPSRYKHPQGLSYLLYIRAAELNQWLLDWPARSLTALAAEWLIFVTGLSASIIFPPQRPQDNWRKTFSTSFFFLKFHMQGRKLDVCLWLMLTDISQHRAVLWVNGCSCSMSGLTTMFSSGGLLA